MQKDSLSAFFGLNKYRRAGAIASLTVLLVLALAITLNALTALLPPHLAKLNLSQDHTFEVSSESIGWIEDNLQSDVTVYWLCAGGIASAESELYNFLLNYAAQSDHIELKVIDPSAVGDAFIERYGGTWPADRSLIVESERRYRIIGVGELYYYYFNDGTNTVTIPSTEYESLLAELLDPKNGYSDADMQTFLSFITSYFDGNARLTNAINFVTRDRLMKVYTLTGSGASALDAGLAAQLDAACHEVGTTLTLANLPSDCDVLVINAPTVDLSTDEAAALSSYLAAGGKLLLTTFYGKTNLPNLAAVLDDYGLGFGGTSGSYVAENHANYALSDTQGIYPMLFKTHMRADHPFSSDQTGSLVVYYPHAISLTEVAGVTLTPWLYTSTQGQLAHYDQTAKKWVYDEKKAEYTVGAIAERGDTQIVWIASPDALTADVDAFSTSSANFTLARRILERLGGTEAKALSISPVQMPMPTLSITVSQLMVWGIFLILVIPATILLVGLIHHIKRKNR